MTRKRWIVLVAVLLSATALIGWFGPKLIRSWFYPAEKSLEEVYEPRPDGPKVDHSLLDAVLAEVVTPRGFVDYKRLQDAPQMLKQYIEQLGDVPFVDLGRHEKLATLINAYNAFTLALILDHWPLKSIKDIPAPERWLAKRWKLGALTLSLEEIEHEYLRPKFRQPLIHFAINCASIGCPPLAARAYQAKGIDAQLRTHAIKVHANSAYVAFDPSAKLLKLTSLYDWFRGDFEQVAGSVIEHVAGLIEEGSELSQASPPPSIEWIDYNWSLNHESKN